MSYNNYPKADWNNTKKSNSTINKPAFNFFRENFIPPSELPSSIFKSKWGKVLKEQLYGDTRETILIVANVILENGTKLYDISMEDSTYASSWEGFYGKGIIYIYSDDRTNVYREVFIKETVIEAEKPKPIKKEHGWFEYGYGPIAKLVETIAGDEGVQKFIKWEENFTESTRIYLTYKAPLTSDIFRISEAINGVTLEGNIKLSTEERVKRLKDGITGIVTLWTGGAYGAMKSYTDSLADHLIDEHVGNEDVKNGLKEGKKQLWKELDKTYKKK